MEQNRTSPGEAGERVGAVPWGDSVPCPLRRWEDAAVCRGLRRGAAGRGERDPRHPPMVPGGSRGSPP